MSEGRRGIKKLYKSNKMTGLKFAFLLWIKFDGIFDILNKKNFFKFIFIFCNTEQNKYQI